MKSNNQNRYQRRRKFFRTLFGVFSLSGILFAFQACYGTPQDFGLDVRVSGKVTSAANQESISGIKVLLSQSGQYVLSGSDGSYQMYCERMTGYKLIFSDIDGTQNGTYPVCDTTVQLNSDSDTLTVNVELR